MSLTALLDGGLEVSITSLLVLPLSMSEHIGIDFFVRMIFAQNISIERSENILADTSTISFQKSD
jgi:hypothetical protein